MNRKCGKKGMMMIVKKKIIQIYFITIAVVVCECIYKILVQLDFVTVLSITAVLLFLLQLKLVIRKG